MRDYQKHIGMQKFMIVSIFVQEKQAAKKNTFFLLYRHWDIQIFLHNEGEEFWLVATEFPIDVVSVNLPVESMENIALIQISLTEKTTTQIDRKTVPCQFYNQNTEFTDCSKEKLWTLLKPIINCTIPQLKSVIPESSGFLECPSTLSAWITYMTSINILVDFLGHVSQYNCPVPCHQRSYNYNLKYLHRNSWINIENPSIGGKNSSILAISYSSMLVEEKIETIVYDLENLLTSVGGNLGLFLGFSCFSTLLTVIEYFSKS